MMKVTLTLCVCLILSGCFPRSIRAGPSTVDPTERAHQLLELSKTQNLENRSLAIQTAQEALALFQSVNDLDGIASTYQQLGDYHFAQYAMADATRYYELALEIGRQKSDLSLQAGALIRLGWIEARLGDWLNGVSYLTQAHNLVDEQRDPVKMGEFASGMGYVFNESGSPERGLEQYQRALEYFRLAKHARGYNRMGLHIGYTHFLLGNYPAAITQVQQALASFESSSEQEKLLDIAECNEYLGRIFIATGEHQLALQHLQPVIEVYRKTQNWNEEAQVQALIGQIYEQQGSLAQARRRYLEASRIFRRISDRVNDASVRFALGRLELNSGNYQAAESYLKESIEHTETIRRDLSARVFAAAFSASVHERYEAYIECLMRKHKAQPSQGFEVVAFEASELVRARSLAELLRDTQTTVFAGANPQLVQRERLLRQAIRANVDQTISLLATNYKKEELDKLESSLTRLRQQHKQLTASLRKYEQVKEPTTYSLKQIQSLVIEDDQTVVLEYLLGQNASYVWAITRDEVKVFELPKAATITEVVRRVYDNLASEPDNETENRLHEATAELGQMILAPVASRLNGLRVIVVADGALNYIPFQLLPNPATPGEPMVAKYEIVNAPSASILGQLRQEKQHRGPRTRVLAAFGDPVFASNYAQVKNSKSGALAASVTLQRGLRDVEMQADAIDPSSIQPLSYTNFELQNLRKLAGPTSFVARDFAASREVLTSMDLSNYAILHFATHGVLDPNKPEQSGFFLSMVDASGQFQNGFIRMEDVYRLHAPVDLVVLSACRTGLGKNVRGEGLIGLTRGFMHAGASSVVASLWKVDDEATSKLMKYFYENMLHKGMTPAQALRTAQNELRQVPHWRSPHFWAGFTLQGEFKEPIRVPASVSNASPLVVQQTVGGGLLMAMLFGIGWGYWRRRRPRMALINTSKN